MGRKYSWFRPEVRREIAARYLAGERAVELAAEFGCSRMSVWQFGQDALVARRRVGQSEHRLSFADREQIAVGIAAGLSNAAIARALGRHRSTIGREIEAAGVPRERYRAIAAERGAQQRLARPKASKLSKCPELLAFVEAGLEARWSPQQICRRLVEEFPDDLGMRISHETIYQSLFVQARGELRKELAANLRSGRTRRRAQGQVERRGRIVGMVPISQRPAEVEDRAVPGHWEGDLLIGAGGRSAVATLVERATRYVLLAKLQDTTSEHLVERLQQQIGSLPKHLVRSLTWDQGKEMAAHASFTVATDVPVYFCDPRSPWQRGSNENTNGLLRQYLPKGTDLSVHSQDDLDCIAIELNGRPRMTLDWKKPAEKMAELLTPATGTQR